MEDDPSVTDLFQDIIGGGTITKRRSLRASGVICGSSTGDDTNTSYAYLGYDSDAQGMFIAIYVSGVLKNYWTIRGDGTIYCGSSQKV